MLILIAGPYRSGTNDDPVLMHQNLSKLEALALPLFRLGHIPIIGEWVALPLLHLAGSTKAGDEIYATYVEFTRGDRAAARWGQLPGGEPSVRAEEVRKRARPDPGCLHPRTGAQ